MISEKIQRNDGVVLKREGSCSFIPEICFNFVGNKVDGSESGIVYCTQVVERKRGAFGIGADCPYRVGGYCVGGLCDVAFHIYYHGV